VDSLDAELFGAEAHNGTPTVKPGLLDVADGGTLFLDEIGELAATLQPKLLGVLEGKCFRRVGGTNPIVANIRIITATAKDLVAAVTEGSFREDLYYGLNVMPVYLPPLRARAREDLTELIAHVIDELHNELSDAPAHVSDEALESMLRYTWPGNVRQLRNVLERAITVARGREQILPMHLAPEVREASGRGRRPHVPRSLEEVERAHIDRTLHANGGNRTRAARELGISRATLLKKIKHFGL
jgi:transcriptional regulator with PAS, ATPase and Fis domain